MLAKHDPAPLSEMQLFGSYSRLKADGTKETWNELCDRVLHNSDTGLFAIGEFTEEERELVDRMMRGNTGDQRGTIAPVSGRWMWVGGTKWLAEPSNWHGAFNCTTRTIRSAKDFALCMNLSMQGCGVGSVLEAKNLKDLPPIKNQLVLEMRGNPGDKEKEYRYPNTSMEIFGVSDIKIIVGDSRQGWADAYENLIDLAMGQSGLFLPPNQQIRIIVDLSNVRPAGERLKGFGGIANPVALPELFRRCVEILNGAVGRRLTALECCLLLDEASSAVVAGGLRRSAAIRQFSSDDKEAAIAKLNMWRQDSEGNWQVDPKKAALRAANHTRVFHHKPSHEEVLESVRMQHKSGEGAIQWAGEAIARSSVDLLSTEDRRKTFLNLYDKDNDLAKDYLASVHLFDNGRVISVDELDHRMHRYGLNPCGEKISVDNHCDLGSVHLANVDPYDDRQQEEAFRAAALQVVALLKRNFVERTFARSRDLDPIIIVSFTHSFDFFARRFGIEWLRWWKQGRTINNPKAGYFLREERHYLWKWRRIVEETVWEYCDRHNLKRPNRCTGLKPEGSQTLLSGTGCCGVHPPKAWRYIRRKTFGKGDPIALACLDFGYSVAPGQNDKDEKGNLLNDPWSDRCTEWLVEVPVEERLIQLFPELDEEDIDPSQFSAAAQFDWFMQVQKYYTTHNTSATLEFRESEIENLATAIHQAIANDRGYISFALLARFDDYQTFPRLPFEPISKETYNQAIKEVAKQRKSDDFQQLISHYLNGQETAPEAACDGTICELPTIK